MPTFKSFCFFASMGILFLYIFVLTFFVGCVTLDERRRKANRDGCLPCVTRADGDQGANECSQQDHQKAFFQRVFAPFLMKTPVKVPITFKPPFSHARRCKYVINFHVAPQIMVPALAGVFSAWNI